MMLNTQRNFCSFKRDSASYFNFLNLPFIFPRVYASEVYELNYKERIKDYMNNETSNERLKKMFCKNEFDLMSPELSYIVKGSISCVVVAAAYGSITAMGQAKEDFMRKNVATPFESEFLARRKLLDTMALSAIRGAILHAMKIGCFGSTYLFLTTTAATYNNKITIYEHVASGALIGSVIRINYGLKGMAVSGSLGGFLGLMSGGIILLAMKLSGVSFQELRYSQHEVYWNEFYKKSLTEAKKRV